MFKKKISWLWLLLAFVIGGVLGASGAKDNTTTTAGATALATTITVSVPAPTTITVSAPAAKAPAPAPTTAAAPAPKPSATTPAQVSFGGDGQYIVGTDIKAGLYKTKGPADSGGDCYYERDKDLSGGLYSIIKNDNLQGPATIQIFATDKAFKTSGCADWVKVG